MKRRDVFKFSSQELPAEAPKQPLLLLIVERPWVPLVIVAPGLALWFLAPMNHTTWFSLVFDAFGVFLGATYMFRLGPQSRREIPVHGPDFRRSSPYSTVLLGKKFGTEDIALIFAFAMIVYVSYFGHLGWPMATNWTSLVMCGVYAAVFDKDWTLRTHRLEMASLLLMISLTIAPPYMFSGRTNQIIFSPIFFVLCTMVSVGIGLMILAQRQKLLLEYERNNLETQMIESRISKEIARELHDSVAHEVAGITVLAQAARMLQQSGTSSPESLGQALESIESSSKRALDSIRKTVQSFNEGRATEFSPTPTAFHDVVKLIREFESAHSLQAAVDKAPGAERDFLLAPQDSTTKQSPRVIVEISPTAEKLTNSDSCEPLPGFVLPDSTCTTLYRIAAEALTNIHKHAPGSYVYICLRVSDKPTNVATRTKPTLDDGPLRHPYLLLNCERFLEDNRKLANSVPYPRVELFIFNSRSDREGREKHFIGRGTGMGHKNIVMRAKALNGAAYVGSYGMTPNAPKPNDSQQPGWLVFCSLPMTK